MRQLATFVVVTTVLLHIQASHYRTPARRPRTMTTETPTELPTTIDMRKKNTTLALRGRVRGFRGKRLRHRTPPRVNLMERILKVAHSNETMAQSLLENIGVLHDEPNNMPAWMKETPQWFKLVSRRSLSGSESNPSIQNQKRSPWCEVAKSCQETEQPVCGFDDKFGFYRFSDFCHMFQVNCYFKFNFSIAPNSVCEKMFILVDYE